MLDEQAYLRLARDDRTRWPTACARPPSGRPLQIATAPGLLTPFFTDEPVRDYAGAQQADHEAYAAWCRALLARGVYAPPSPYEAWFVSTVHGPEHVDRTIEAAAAAFAEIA